MSKYINADEFISYIRKKTTPSGAEWTAQRVREMPAADVVEVKHGEWENKLPDGWQCSECFEIIPLKFMTMFCWGGNRMNFCPRCGADMRGRNQNDRRRRKNVQSPDECL